MTQPATDTATVRTTRSDDGTVIAYEAYGSGPVVAVVGGATCVRGYFRDTAQALAGLGFTGVTYDRRGRGDSTDTEPYAVEREVEDLAAVVAAAGDPSAPDTPAYAHGLSSGGALVLQALAAGVPLARASALETPYRGEGAPPMPHDYVGRLRALVAADDRAGIMRLFHCEAVGLPEESLEAMRGTAAWPPMLEVAPTILYDALCLGGDDVSQPTDMLARIETPFLSLCSTGTMMPFLHDAPAVTAALLPHGLAAEVEGGFHEVPGATMAPVLASFYRDGSVDASLPGVVHVGP